jgi:hypothetical protein
METRDSYYKDLLDFDLSPKESNLFYFPCGSISSFHESMSFADDSKDHEWSLLRRPMEASEKPVQTAENLNYIPYEPVQGDRCDVRDFAATADFSLSLRSKPPTVDACTSTDLSMAELQSLQSQAQHSVATIEGLSSVLRAKQLECEEVTKSSRAETAAMRERIKNFEVDFLKLKLIIEDLADQDGTSRTSRQPADAGFEALKIKLETVKRRLGQKQGSDGAGEKWAVRKVPQSPGPRKGQATDRKMSRDFDEEMHTERPKSSCAVEYEVGERISYREVLRDLREITTRASNALKNSKLNRRSNLPTGVSFKKEEIERIRLDQRLVRPRLCKNY